MDGKGLQKDSTLASSIHATFYFTTILLHFHTKLIANCETFISKFKYKGAQIATDKTFPDDLRVE